MTPTLAPGAYFLRPVEARQPVRVLRTDVAGFVGVAGRGPLDRAVRVDGPDVFRSVYGGPVAQGFLAYAVDGFFANGGRRCWVARVAGRSAAPARWVLRDTEGAVRAELRARSAGTWADSLHVRVRNAGAYRFSLEIVSRDGDGEVWPDLDTRPTTEDGSPNPDYFAFVLNAPDLRPHEAWPEPRRTQLGPEDEAPGRAADASGSPELLRWSIASRVGPATDGRERFDGIEPPGRGSRLVEVAVVHPPRDRAGWVPRDGLAQLVGPRSGDGLEDLAVADFGGSAIPPPDPGDAEPPRGLDLLAGVDEVSIVACPDLHGGGAPARSPRPRPVRCFEPPAAPPPRLSPPPAVEGRSPFSEEEVRVLQHRLLRHCEGLGDRFAVLDVPRGDLDFTQATAWRRTFTSRFGALYHPWLRVPDPLGRPGDLRDVPASGHVAGIYARVSLDPGVHRAPANVGLAGAKDVSRAIDAAEHALLNRAHVNVLRDPEHRGLRVMGARTLDADPQWRWVPVRRLLIFIGEWLESSLQWAVFEPHADVLRADVARAVRSMLERLWLRGMLDGPTAEDAFTVKCDDETNTEDVVDAGRLSCLISLRPPPPAEIVTVRLGLGLGGFEFGDAGGAHG